MTAVALVDSGGANIASLGFALQRLGASAVLTRDRDIIRSAERVILPGVGAAADAMRRLREAELVQELLCLKQPVLGICLGMQLLAMHSDEDDTDCLGVIEGTAGKLPASPEHPVPNMGWCPVRIDKVDPLLDGIADGSYFYFLHSFALPAADHTLASAAHATRFSAVLRRDNFCATQFHPERSAAPGARLLKNFLSLAA